MQYPWQLCHGYYNEHSHKLQCHIFLLPQQTASQREAMRVCGVLHNSSHCKWETPTETVYNFYLNFWNLQTSFSAEMPIASGATGRMDVSTTWTPDGQKKKSTFSYYKHDSYLQQWVHSLSTSIITREGLRLLIYICYEKENCVFWRFYQKVHILLSNIVSVFVKC